MVLAGFRKLLEPEFDLVGIAENGHMLVDLVLNLRPDIILADVSMPLLNGFDAVRQILRSTPNARVIFLTMHSDREYVSEALRIGARGYLLKRSAASELVLAIREVLEGKMYVTPLVSREPANQIAAGLPAREPDLTNRQREVLQLVAEGHPNKEIARILRLSMKTVEFHKNNLSKKLNIHNTADLTRYAIQHHIVSI